MVNKKINYTDQGKELEGYLAYPDEKKKYPAVLIAHSWAGRDQFVCDKAEALARLGYVGFALDLYGDAKTGSSKEENAQLMEPFMKDRKLLLRRMLAGLDAVKSLNMVDVNNIAAMGFCFGGLCVLDLARSGAHIKGVVSFHGLLQGPDYNAREKILAKILVLQGFDDPMVSPEQVLKFEKEMSEANADWQLHMYGKTMHAFTNPKANDREFGTVYNPIADKRSWQTMQDFFKEIF